ncbi:MAG: ATP-dependent DNA helicase DinG [Nitrospirae bacterium]|nr:MAG: ATP-dependent DNA helicase DinG [Nitrospirota bacterium]
MSSSLGHASVRFLLDMAAPSMPGFEHRESQEQLIAACAEATERGGALMAEAGTGTGKTFAYLIPIIVSGRRAIISTRTINLQEQLVRKDLRFLSSVVDFSYAIAKGRSNYLCLRRLNAFRSEDASEEREYRRIAQWSADTRSGDVEDFGVAVFSVWDRVCTDADACTGKACAHFSRCYYFEAKRQWEEAQIIVSNHALTSINALLSKESKLLPQAELLVVDEAHGLEKVLSDQIGITLSNRSFDYVLNRLLRIDDRGVYKGLLSLSPPLFPAVEMLKFCLADLWNSVRGRYQDRRMMRGRLADEEKLNAVAAAVGDVVEKAQEGTLGLFQEDEEIELKASLLKLGALADACAGMMEENQQTVRWAEIEPQRTALRLAPLYPRSFVRTNILPEYETSIFTSATLSVSGDFSFMQELLGLEDAATISLSSPFDISRQVQVEFRTGIDLRNDETGVRKLADVIVEAAGKEVGGILVLFTSRDAMRKTWEHAADELRAAGRRAMMQGDEYQNRAMLEIMRECTNAVIFGLDSFWEGVDVQGDSLRCLVIAKLPFEVPTEPITMARTEDLQRRGRNAFMEYSLPRAVLKFKQGFGRLIRSKTDTGRVIICDERIRTKRYGQAFLKSIGKNLS